MVYVYVCVCFGLCAMISFSAYAFSCRVWLCVSLHGVCLFVRAAVSACLCVRVCVFRAIKCVVLQVCAGRAPRSQINNPLASPSTNERPQEQAPPYRRSFPKSSQSQSAVSGVTCRPSNDRCPGERAGEVE